MAAAEGRWNESAEIYAAVAPKIRFYMETSQRIVAMAALKEGMSVVDLGCGSACLTVSELLSRYPALRIVYCVDASEPMLSAASQRVFSSRVRFIRSSAEELHVNLGDTVDCVICNSAFWMFDPISTLRAIRQVLRPGGSFLCNYAEWDMNLGGTDHPRYAAIDRQLFLAGLPAKPSRGSNHKWSFDDIRALLLEEGFSLEDECRFEIPVSASEWSYFYTIPAIAAQSLPNLPLDLALKVLQRAMSSLDSTKLPEIKWITLRSECGLDAKAAKQR